MSDVTDPFVPVNDDGELVVNFASVVVEPLPPGRRNTDVERRAQREAILAAALRSVEQHGAVGLQPEKVAAATNGSVTSQSMRRAFRDQLDPVGGPRRSLRDVLESELIAMQLRAFDSWLRSTRVRSLRSEEGMVEGLRRIAQAVLRNPALTRLRTSDRERLEAFLSEDERAAPLVDALCHLAVRCLHGLPGSVDAGRVREFVERNVRLLADDLALLRLDTDEGARCFVRHLREYATK